MSTTPPTLLVIGSVVGLIPPQQRDVVRDGD